MAGNDNQYCTSHPELIYALSEILFTTPSVYTYNAYNTSQTQYGRGRRTGMSDASGSTVWRYDQSGRLWYESKAITGSGTFLTQWGYNSADQMIWMKYPGGSASQIGEQVSYTYTTQGLLYSVLGSSNYVTSRKYDAAGREERRYLGNGLSTQYDYNAWGTQGRRLKTLKTGSGAPWTPTLQNFEYSYDAGGNVSWIKDYLAAGGTQTQNFGYDTLQRLTSASASGGTGGIYSESYSYHPDTGNLYTKSGLGTYTYSSTHKHAVASISNGWGFQYNDNVNMTQRVAGATYNLTYDLENHLVAVGSQTTAKYYYDGNGARVRAIEGATTTIYVGAHFEWSGSTATIKKHYFAGSQHLAVRSGTGSGNVSLIYTIPDHLGSSVATVDAATLANTFIRYYPR